MGSEVGSLVAQSGKEDGTRAKAQRGEGPQDAADVAGLEVLGSGKTRDETDVPRDMCLYGRKWNAKNRAPRKCEHVR